MPRSFDLTCCAAAALGLALPIPSAKPCTGAASASLEALLPQVRTALDLAGTDQVAIDDGRRCIGVQVRTEGTARLVKLLLRGLEVPREAVDLRVVEVKPTRGA